MLVGIPVYYITRHDENDLPLVLCEYPAAVSVMICNLLQHGYLHGYHIFAAVRVPMKAGKQLQLREMRT